MGWVTGELIETIVNWVAKVIVGGLDILVMGRDTIQSRYGPAS